LDSAQKLQIAGLLSNQKDEIANDDFNTQESEFDNLEAVEERKSNFEISGKNSQNEILKYKSVASVSGHDQIEVNRKINEILIKEDDYFKCAACGKKSKDKRNMKRHVEIHIEGLSYECQFCEKTFRNKHMLQNHIHRNHRGFYFQDKYGSPTP